MARKVKRGGKSWKAGYSAYKAENRVQKNAISRLQRHISSYPGDLGAVAQLEKIKKEGRPYRRNKARKTKLKSPLELYYQKLLSIKLQLPVVIKRGPPPEWKQKLAQAFGLS